MARYAAYKVEQDKRSQGAGAREAIAAGRSANEDPSALVQYTMGEKIGAGAYACVRAAWVKESGDRVAVKVYEKAHLNRESRRRNVYREVHVLAKVRHKHIIGFREWFATDRHIYIVMEYVCGGSLQSLLRKQPASRFDDGTAKRLFAQVCEGIGYCHSLRVVHRDIKLDNVLLDRNCCVKIIDFGFAVAIPQGQKLKIFCGTPSYIAPEIISGQPYAFPGDVWALGVLLYVLLAGRFPFKASTQRELYRRIVRGSFQALEGCVPESRELIDACSRRTRPRGPLCQSYLAGRGSPGSPPSRPAPPSAGQLGPRRRPPRRTASWRRTPCSRPVSEARLGGASRAQFDRPGARVAPAAQFHPDRQVLDKACARPEPAPARSRGRTRALARRAASCPSERARRAFRTPIVTARSTACGQVEVGWL
jgi:serine/threonine protein kinase